MTPTRSGRCCPAARLPGAGHQPEPADRAGRGHGAGLLTLDLLTESEAVELLERRLGRERAVAEPAAVAELAGLCARLPLALAVAAARAVAKPGLPLAVLAGELRDMRARLDGLGTGDAAHRRRTVFSWSCQQLTQPSARLFRLLGVHPGPRHRAPGLRRPGALPSRRVRHSPNWPRRT